MAARDETQQMCDLWLFDEIRYRCCNLFLKEKSCSPCLKSYFYFYKHLLPLNTQPCSKPIHTFIIELLIASLNTETKTENSFSNLLDQVMELDFPVIHKNIVIKFLHTKIVLCFYKKGNIKKSRQFFNSCSRDVLFPETMTRLLSQTQSTFPDEFSIKSLQKELFPLVEDYMKSTPKLYKLFTILVKKKRKGEQTKKATTMVTAATQTTLNTKDVCVEAKPSSSITVFDLVQGHQQVDVRKTSSFMLSPSGRVSKTPVKRSLSEPDIDLLKSPGRKRLWSLSHQQLSDIASPSKRIRRKKEFQSPQKISTEQHLKSNRPGNKTALLVSQPITTTPTQNPSLPFLLSQESTSIEQPSNPSEVPVIKDTDDSQEGRDPTGKDNNVDFGLHLITPPKQNTRHNQNHSPEMFSSYEHATLSKGSKSDPIDVDVMGRTKSDRSRSGNRSSNGSSGSGNSYDRKTSSDRDKFRFPESTQRTRAASKMCRRELATPHKKINRLKFTEAEEKNLVKGIERFGVGNWANILRNFKFHQVRTNVNLKDKYRTMVKQGLIDDPRTKVVCQC